MKAKVERENILEIASQQVMFMKNVWLHGEENVTGLSQMQRKAKVWKVVKVDLERYAVRRKLRLWGYLQEISFKQRVWFVRKHCVTNSCPWFGEEKFLCKRFLCLIRIKCLRNGRVSGVKQNVWQIKGLAKCFQKISSELAVLDTVLINNSYFLFFYVQLHIYVILHMYVILM